MHGACIHIHLLLPSCFMNTLIFVNQVRYLTSSADSFNQDNLEVSIQLNGKTVTWKPTPASQESLGGNLKGTIRVSYSPAIN